MTNHRKPAIAADKLERMDLLELNGAYLRAAIYDARNEGYWVHSLKHGMPHGERIRAHLIRMMALTQVMLNHNDFDAISAEEVFDAMKALHSLSQNQKDEGPWLTIDRLTAQRKSPEPVSLDLTIS